MKTNLKKMFAVTIALSVLSFGFTVRAVDSAGRQSKEEVKLAAALSGWKTATSATTVRERDRAAP